MSQSFIFSFSISSSNEYPRMIPVRIDWFDLLAVQGTLKSLLQHWNLKGSILRCSAFFMVQLSHPYMTIGKTIALTIWTFVGKVMSMLFNLLSRFVIALPPSNKHLSISWLQSRSAVILEPKKRTSVTVSTFYLSICQEVMGLYASYHLSPIKRLFSSFSFSAIRVVSSAYLRLLFLSAILISACNPSSLAFNMMYPAQKLNK